MSRPYLSVGLATVRDPNDQHRQDAVVDGVNHTVVANTNAILVVPAFKLFMARRPGVLSQCCDGLSTTNSNIQGKCSKIFLSLLRKTNGITQAAFRRSSKPNSLKVTSIGITSIRPASISPRTRSDSAISSASSISSSVSLGTIGTSLIESVASRSLCDQRSTQ